MSSQARKEKSNNTGNLPLGTLLFSSSYVDIESTNTVFSDLINKYKQVPKEKKSKKYLFLTHSNNYIMIEEFKDELKLKKH